GGAERRVRVDAEQLRPTPREEVVEGGRALGGLYLVPEASERRRGGDRPGEALVIPEALVAEVRQPECVRTGGDQGERRPRGAARRVGHAPELAPPGELALRDPPEAPDLGQVEPEALERATRRELEPADE